MLSDIRPQVQTLPRAQTRPLPRVVADSIRHAIRRGRLGPNQKLPSEPQLAEQLGVSRATVRDALRILTIEGLLLRQHGVGTFVSAVPSSQLGAGLSELTSTTQLIRQHGYRPGTSGRPVEASVTEPRIASLFGLSEQTPLLRISRTRSASGRPVIHCEEFVPAGVLHDTPAHRARAGDWSLYDALRGEGIRIASAICKVAPVAANAELGARLNVKPGHPLLLLKQLHYTAKGEPVLYCENFHNSDLIEFYVARRA
jgi:GntR family transcriptional regulator